MGDSGDSAMDSGMAAQSGWAAAVAMGNGGCHSGRWQQRWHDPNWHQQWLCNGWQDRSNSTIAIAMNGGGSNGRQQWWWHNSNG
jgi:hypothetical protein